MRVSIALVALLALSACNKDKENSTTITTADGKEVKITSKDGSNDGGTVTMETKDGGTGTFSYGTNATKQPLPLDLPVFPGATVSSAVTGSQDGKSGGMFTIESKTGTAQQIADFYLAEAKKRGMTSEESGNIGSVTGGSMAGFRAKGKDGQNIVLSARPGGPNGEVHAMLIVGND